MYTYTFLSCTMITTVNKKMGLNKFYHNNSHDTYKTIYIHDISWTGKDRLSTNPIKLKRQCVLRSNL